MIRRIEQRAEAAAEAAAARIAEAVRDEVPDVTVSREAGRVTIAGRGLARRRFEEPALRWIGGLVR